MFWLEFCTHFSEYNLTDTKLVQQTSKYRFLYFNCVFYFLCGYIVFEWKKVNVYWAKSGEEIFFFMKKKLISDKNHIFQSEFKFRANAYAFFSSSSFCVWCMTFMMFMFCSISVITLSIPLYCLFASAGVLPFRCEFNLWLITSHEYTGALICSQRYIGVNISVNMVFIVGVVHISPHEKWR